MMRQIYLGTLDLTIHGEDVPQTEEALQALVDKLNLEISLIANPAGCNMLRNFGHLMNQYSAAYYGYLWAEVLSVFLHTFLHNATLEGGAWGGHLLLMRTTLSIRDVAVLLSPLLLTRQLRC